ncbi:MAG: hypothetical protein VKJ64_00590 [Leptolyngbyaceae bacterium]|nr:hypothetical protein [Leptolyngbyaceae bacterium]
MEVIELKFLLALLGHPPDYHTALSELRPTESRSDRNRACRQLRDRGLISCSEEIIQFRTSSAGQALLALDSKNIPLTTKELRLLQSGTSGLTTPGKALKGTAPGERQVLLEGLHTRGLIQAETQVKEVWLTPEGYQYLLQECNPSGNHTVSFNFLSNYINFLRTQINHSGMVKGSAAAPSVATGTRRWPHGSKPNVTDIVELLQTLDHELDTQNYLPLFHLREAVQPPLQREELDDLLYQLQRQDQIELSSLQDGVAFTPEQLKAGIPQDIGGPLFFISLCE